MTRPKPTYPCPHCLQLTTNYGLCDDCKERESGEASEAQIHRLKKYFNQQLADPDSPFPRTTVIVTEEEAHLYHLHSNAHHCPSTSRQRICLRDPHCKNRKECELYGNEYPA